MPAGRKATKLGFELEYNSLRGEILKRIELRQQLISITLTLAGVFLGIGLGTESVALIYPPLAMFLAFGWAQNDFRIRNSAEYIREHLENLTTGLKYEHEVQTGRTSTHGLGSWRFVVISHIGIFIFTQIMALVIELARFNFNFVLLSLTQWILLVVDLISILFVLWIAKQSTR
jgi:hypothetical protein